MSTSKVLMI